jgi:dTMP kinase
LNLSKDPYESFKIFQGRILEQYMAMSKEFKFVTVDANDNIEKQQVIVRKLVSERIDLKKFKRRSPLPLPPSLPAAVEEKEELEEKTA